MKGITTMIWMRMFALTCRWGKNRLNSLKLVNLKSRDYANRSAKTTLRFTKACLIKVIISFKA